MTRCEEFSRGEYAPRLLAYFLFLKSLLHEITHSGEPVKSIPEIPKIKKLKRRLFLRRLLFSFHPARNRIFQSSRSRKRVKDENYLNTGLQRKVSRIRGIPFFPPGDLERSAFSTTCTSSPVQMSALFVQKETWSFFRCILLFRFRVTIRWNANRLTYSLFLIFILKYLEYLSFVRLLTTRT